MTQRSGTGFVALLIAGIVAWGCADTGSTSTRPAISASEAEAVFADLPVLVGMTGAGAGDYSSGTSSVTYDVRGSAPAEVLSFYHRALPASGWRVETLHAPTGTSAGGPRRADFSKDGLYLQVTVVPTPKPVQDFSGVTCRVSLILSRAP